MNLEIIILSGCTKLGVINIHTPFFLGCNNYGCPFQIHIRISGNETVMILNLNFLKNTDTGCTTLNIFKTIELYALKKFSLVILF